MEYTLVLLPINRRQFLLSSLAAIASGAERPPNFIIILAGDGYGELTCFGSSSNETPRYSGGIPKNVDTTTNTRRKVSVPQATCNTTRITGSLCAGQAIWRPR